jgi:hypothetical protein
VHRAAPVCPTAPQQPPCDFKCVIKIIGHYGVMPSPGGCGKPEAAATPQDKGHFVGKLRGFCKKL